MMTISRSQPSFLDIETLKQQNATVGCNKGSVMKRAVLDVMSFHPQNVKEIPSIDLFPNAFESGDIQAAFMSAPHAKVFLAKHCKDYTKVTIFKLLGMAFVSFNFISFEIYFFFSSLVFILYLNFKISNLYS